MNTNEWLTINASASSSSFSFSSNVTDWNYFNKKHRLLPDFWKLRVFIFGRFSIIFYSFFFHNYQNISVPLNSFLGKNTFFRRNWFTSLNVLWIKSIFMRNFHLTIIKDCLNVYVLNLTAIASLFMDSISDRTADLAAALINLSVSASPTNADLRPCFRTDAIKASLSASFWSSSIRSLMKTNKIRIPF